MVTVTNFAGLAGSRTGTPAAGCQAAPGKCVTAQIDLAGAGAGIYPSLFGTGILGGKPLDKAAVNIGGVSVAPTLRRAAVFVTKLFHSKISKDMLNSNEAP